MLWTSEKQRGDVQALRGGPYAPANESLVQVLYQAPIEVRR
jgi:hypothetical protein